MFIATSTMVIVEITKASHVPSPANAKTSGMVITGAQVGAMLATDCASVSLGDRTAGLSPYDEWSTGIDDGVAAALIFSGTSRPLTSSASSPTLPSWGS